MVQRLVVDCDTGVDDALALFMAVSASQCRKDSPSLGIVEYDLVGVTCVAGNVGLDQVCTNTQRVMEACGASDIPIYPGADGPLVRHGEDKDAGHFHGLDGLGDTPDTPPLPRPFDKAERSHAVTFLTEQARQGGGLVIVAIGPLTNIALAIRMYPDLPRAVDRLVVMGGNCEGRGNITMAAEFNFHADPEAAHIVFQAFETKGIPRLQLVCWEMTLRHSVSWEWFDEWLGVGTDRAAFAKAISAYSADQCRQSGWTWCGCDQIAMAVMMAPANIREASYVYATVETGGVYTRGMCVIDSSTEIATSAPEDGKKRTMMLVKRFDMDAFRDICIASVSV